MFHCFIAKESIFSGLNNLEVNTILRYNFNDKFGFTENEVEKLVNYYNAEENIEIVKKWNKEVHIFYENLIEKWFKETLNNQTRKVVMADMMLC